MPRIRARRAASPPLLDMVPAEQIPASRSATTAASPPPAVAPELQARRERLLEQFTLTQLELGGAFYEMAIRDHVSIDALLPRAAELQRIDGELAQVDQLIASGGAVSGSCPACEAPFARGAVFCWQCGSPLGVTETDA